MSNKLNFDIEFPSNPFEDIKPSEFNKLNKKHVTEDFVEENLKKQGWDVFRPFNDTGIDRIITKIICPKGHTKIHENLRDKSCPICKVKGIEITRFIQVKTRQLKKNIFGFTLKSKDIRIDPRHVYLLYSDNSSKDKQDFLIISVKEYLSFFDKNKINPFSSMSFRKGNNKLNSLKYHPDKDLWSWNGKSWEEFRNLKGLSKIQSADIDLNLPEEIIKTRDLANRLQRVFSKGRSYSEHAENTINKILKINLIKYSNKKDILNLREKVELYLEKNCDEETLSSMRKYFEFIKTIETIGGEEDSEESKELIKEMEKSENE